MSTDGATGNLARVRVEGKFFRAGGRRFLVKGVTYGPLSAGGLDGGFLSPTATARDLQSARELGANTLRIYQVPPRWFLDLAAENGLRLLIDIPWPHHLCFLDRLDLQREAINTVTQAVSVCRGHPAVFAYSVANEIPGEIVRWQGARRTAAFVDRLIAAGRDLDPEALFTWASYPPTEYLQTQNADFLCFNVFLHERRSFTSYLARLQMLANTRPLLLGETGIDSLREGEARQAEILDWQIECAFQAGLAGITLFSLTDEWYRDGRRVDDWAFGLTNRQRRPKAAFWKVQSQFAAAPGFTRTRWPKVSVVVACYNGGPTLAACLEALGRLRYPDFEVLLVDDGSSDETAQIALSYPNATCLRQPHRGLSAARNTGIAAARGEIIAFTDADCRPDEDWLLYLVDELLRGGYAAVGGHNLLPPDDSRVATAVMASPGGPAHVMLTDREAEHVPGCNMAFHRWALEEIGGFDPVFHRAGDDVDVCWRLLERGHRIGFSSGGFVWHHRRSTVRAYLGQQSGYGEAEAQLARKHPEFFNALGGGTWRGRIYSAASPGVRLRKPVIYHGPFAAGMFQRIYEPVPETLGSLFLSLEYHALVTLPLLALSLAFPLLLPLAVVSLALSLAVCALAGVQAPIPAAKRAFWSRLLVSGLFFLQPIVRGWARYRWRLTARSVRPTTFRRTGAGRPRWNWITRITLRYWSDGGVTRFDLLRQVFQLLDLEGWEWRKDSGWGEHDAEISGQRWSRVRLATASEEYGEGRRTLSCRLYPQWSLTARCGLGVLALLEVTGLVVAVPRYPWAWGIVTALPALVFLIERERRHVVQLLAALVEEAATALGLLRQFPTMPNMAGPTPEPPAASPNPPPASG